MMSGSATIAQSVARSWSWSLDPVGNWSQYVWDADGDGAGAELTQSRAHNTANPGAPGQAQIAGNSGNPISGTGAADWVDPTYDPSSLASFDVAGEAGNMTAGPKPGDETTAASTQWYAYDAWNPGRRLFVVAS